MHTGRGWGADTLRSCCHGWGEPQEGLATSSSWEAVRLWGVITNFRMLSSWIVWVASQCDKRSPDSREEQEILRLRHAEGKSPMKRGQRRGRELWTRQPPGAGRGRKHPSLESSGGRWLLTAGTGMSAFWLRTERETVSGFWNPAASRPTISRAQ